MRMLSLRLMKTVVKEPFCYFHQRIILLIAALTDVCQHLINKAWKAILNILKISVCFNLLLWASNLCLQYWPSQGEVLTVWQELQRWIFTATYRLHSSCSRSCCEGTPGFPRSSSVLLCGSGSLLQTQALPLHDPYESKQW